MRSPPGPSAGPPGSFDELYSRGWWGICLSCLVPGGFQQATLPWPVYADVGLGQQTQSLPGLLLYV